MVSLQQRIRTDTIFDLNLKLPKQMHQLLLQRLLPLSNKKNTHREDQPAKSSKEKAPASPKKVAAPVSQQAPEIQPLTEQQKDQEAPSSQVKISDKTADKAPSSFNFEAELQKIKIPIPLVELMKNEMFKRDILRTLDPQSVSHSADILNIYDDKPTITLGPMVEDRDESCPSILYLFKHP
jgi:hypothetical protein